MKKITFFTILDRINYQKHLDNTLLRDVLKDTEFSDLIDKFESAGDYNFNNFFIANREQNGSNYLKNFEPDDVRRLRLTKLLQEELSEIVNGPMMFLLKWFSILVFGLILWMVIDIYIV